jgi:hypothetical protein
MCDKLLNLIDFLFLTSDNSWLACCATPFLPIVSAAELTNLVTYGSQTVSGDRVRRPDRSVASQKVSLAVTVLSADAFWVASSLRSSQ